MLRGCASSLPGGPVRAGLVRRLFSSGPCELGNGIAEPADYTPVDYGESFSFEIVKRGPGGARLGVLNTPHGPLHTPAFIFCATKAAVKGATIDAVKQENTQIILSNTYHLMVQPGAELIQEMGGLHRFMNWEGPMLTDSGGYQIFSMGGNSVGNEIKMSRGRSREISKSAQPQNLEPSEESGLASSQALQEDDTPVPPNGPTLLGISEVGATFRSYVNGTLHTLTPETSMLTQRRLGADLVVVLDECTPFHVDPAYTELSMNRSHRWAIRSLREFRRHHDRTQALYGIVQGGVDLQLRNQSVDFIKALPFFGIAIGGSLGDSIEKMYEIIEHTRAQLGDTDKPVHLLGIGGVADIFHGVRCGIDSFDCVAPTRMARHGNALVMSRHWDGDTQRTDPARDDGSTDPEKESGAADDADDVNNSINTPEMDAATFAKQLNELDVSIAEVRRQLKNCEKLQVQAWVALNKSQSNNRSGAGVTGMSNSKRLKLYSTAQEGLLSDRPREKLLVELDALVRQRRELQIQSSAEDRKTYRTASRESSQKKVIRSHFNLTKSANRHDPRPIDPLCECYTCTGLSAADRAAGRPRKGFSRAYLHHLFKADGESTLAGTLLTIHNIHFMNKLMEDIRNGIASDTLDAVEARYLHPDRQTAFKPDRLRRR